MSDEFMDGDIERLRPTREVNDSPAGRMWAIDEDKHLLYVEMWRIMQAGQGDQTKEEYEGSLNEILDVLIDLDKRQAEAFAETFVCGS